jgi:HAD superfamily hydrolase (TIGR01484 family)
MLPIESADKACLAKLQGLIFDLDDTFLDHGELRAASYQALADLDSQGLTLIVATGRPAGWGEVLARMWPVAAVVTENGAIAHRRTAGKLACIDALSPSERLHTRNSLEHIAADLEQRFPELGRTDDAHARISDITYDVGEYRSVPKDVVAMAIEHARSLGARTTVSSVHLHITLDQHDKATGVLHVLRTQLGWDTTRARTRFGFIGDSGNDAPCFAAFSTSIAVSNMSGRPSVTPRFITRGARGAGFVEAARHILAARR